MDTGTPSPPVSELGSLPLALSSGVSTCFTQDSSGEDLKVRWKLRPWGWEAGLVWDPRSVPEAASFPEPG